MYGCLGAACTGGLQLQDQAQIACIRQVGLHAMRPQLHPGQVVGALLLLSCRYTTGKVIGAGSFGIVREVTDRKTNRKYACKTIPKIPKRGKGTPRYLLKIQQEVDAMMQIGPSLDAVFLAVSGWPLGVCETGVCTPCGIVCKSWPLGSCSLKGSAVGAAAGRQKEARMLLS